MPTVKEDSSEGFVRRTILLDRVSSPANVYEVYGEPAYYRYINLGDNWRVSMVAFGDKVEFQAAHRKELKLTETHPTLRQLLDAIKEEFGSDYLPSLPGPSIAVSEETMLILEDLIPPTTIQPSPFVQMVGRAHRE